MHPFTFQFRQKTNAFELSGSQADLIEAFIDERFSKLQRGFDALEEALTQAYEELEMTRSDAQGVVQAILMQVK